MVSPLFTIGIPTYNRAEFLKESLQAALSQSYENIQVVVSDNASTDHTEEVVRSFKDPRIKYSRNDENIGPFPNFARAVDLADGHFFSWLQDDDLIFADFAKRAVKVMTQFESNTYLGTSLYSSTVRAVVNAKTVGPPVPTDWLGTKTTLIDMETMVGLSLLISVAIPPVVVFTTVVLRDKVTTLRGNTFPLFAERTIVLESSNEASFIADTTVCGFFRSHDAQSSFLWFKDRERVKREWRSFALMVNYKFPNINLTSSGLLRQTLDEVPLSVLKDWVEASADWPNDIELCYKMKSLLLERSAKRKLEFDRTKFSTVWKNFGRGLCPPILWKAMRRFITCSATTTFPL